MKWMKRRLPIWLIMPLEPDQPSPAGMPKLNTLMYDRPDPDEISDVIGDHIELPLMQDVWSVQLPGQDFHPYALETIMSSLMHIPSIPGFWPEWVPEAYQLDYMIKFYEIMPRGISMTIYAGSMDEAKAIAEEEIVKLMTSLQNDYQVSSADLQYVLDYFKET